jgi:Hypervirulence associated proteins TUDOR domain
MKPLVVLAGLGKGDLRRHMALVLCNLPPSSELSSRLHLEDDMAKQLKTGDKVAWRSSGGGSVGRVERKLTSPGMIKGHEVAAAHDNPEYLVRSEKSGKIAAHKPAALRRVP